MKLCNQEVNYIPKFIKYLEEVKVDAVIVGDLGIMQQVKEHAPNLEIHISTQATNINWMTVKVYKDVKLVELYYLKWVCWRNKQIKEKVPDIELKFCTYVNVYGCFEMFIKYFTSRDTL